MRKCEVEGCDKKHHASGYCKKHYMIFKRHGDPRAGSFRIGCEVDGCNNKYFAKGYCSNHYSRFTKYGDPLYTKTELHGLSKSSEYRVWVDIKTRCYNKNANQFDRYGGRGINICDKWKYSFSAFYKDMGEKPFPKAQIDRIDNDGNYEPDNCRWVTHVINVRNSSCSKITIQKVNEVRTQYNNGESTITELSEIYGVNRRIIQNIIRQKTWLF